MVDLAIGSQTAGSVIRPASFCGVLGMKATFGLLSTAGLKPAAPSLDTVGLMARDFDVLEAAWTALTGLGLSAGDGDPAYALVRTDFWDEPTTTARTSSSARRLGWARRRASSQRCSAASLPSCKPSKPSREQGLSPGSATPIRNSSPRSCARSLDRGDRVETGTYLSVRRRAARARAPESLEALFGAADVIVTPAAVGEAPEGLDSTGAPRFNRLWTLLGCPALTVPGCLGATGLPIGVQLIARPYREAMLLGAGRRLAASFG